MTSITEFILARVAEDEERAREALKPSDIDVFMDEKRSFYTTVGAHRDDWGLYTFNVPVERVLAECAAKRRAMERHGGRHICEDGMAGERWDDEANDLIDWPCDDARILAAIWVNHADYDARWSR